MQDGPYKLAPKFARELASALCERPSLCARIGASLDPGGFEDKTVKLIVTIVQSMMRELGRGPSSYSLVAQRVETLVHQGKVTREDADEVFELLMATTVASDDELVASIGPILTERARRSAMREFANAYSSGGKLSEVVPLLEKADRIGIAREDVGMVLSDAGFTEIERLRKLDKLSTGILPLDAILGGGLRRGELGLFISVSGGGKSIWLNSQAANALTEGAMVTLATLELAPEIIFARIVAALTGVPIDMILEHGETEARERLAQMLPHLGTLVIGEFPAGIATAPDIIDWNKQIEAKFGRPVDLAVVDYADKVRSHRREDRDNTNKAQGFVLETFRLWAHKEGKWFHTASAAQRRDSKKRGARVQNDDVADSIEKIRVADKVFTGTPQEGKMLDIFVGKNRTGRSEESVTVATDFPCGRICRVDYITETDKDG